MSPPKCLCAGQGGVLLCPGPPVGLRGTSPRFISGLHQRDHSLGILMGSPARQFSDLMHTAASVLDNLVCWVSSTAHLVILDMFLVVTRRAGLRLRNPDLAREILSSFSFLPSSFLPSLPSYLIYLSIKSNLPYLSVCQSI